MAATQADRDARPDNAGRGGAMDRFLTGVEAVGNRLPDPAILLLYDGCT